MTDDHRIQRDQTHGSGVEMELIQEAPVPEGHERVWDRQVCGTPSQSQ